MKVTILGAGDITKIHRYSGTSEKNLEKLIQDLGKLLAERGDEIIIVPARGIPYEVAKAYKKYKGKQVIGAIPKDDKDFGIMHIQEYLGIADTDINIGDWYDLNGRIASLGDYAICIGLSGGAICDIAMLKYHYKYLGSKTKLIVFRNTISCDLPKELEEDLKGNLTYVNSINELKKVLK
jgi:hypothetical protein